MLLMLSMTKVYVSLCGTSNTIVECLDIRTATAHHHSTETQKLPVVHPLGHQQRQLKHPSVAESLSELPGGTRQGSREVVIDVFEAS